MLQARNIRKAYGTLQVLKGVDVRIDNGEVVALIGSSGAGKSTLLQILGTLDEPDEGEVEFKGKMITSQSSKEKSTFRNQSLGFVFQFHHLLPEFTALENVCIPAFIAGKNKTSTIQRAASLLDRLGLKDRAGHKPSALSGGEQQRVSMARALINEPELILADEPTGNLDTQNSQDLYAIIWELARETGVGFMIATHNLILADRADRIYHIKDGIIVLE